MDVKKMLDKEYVPISPHYISFSAIFLSSSYFQSCWFWKGKVC